ncbi:hypothetical protein [uncultured Fibrobacter sp.]|uniref:hypothetical protein n=1 Tax=uncultured Fibrobacter sp. TaxID=261512 RepID=UPI00260BCD2F|nr:hypothetical protein [uncultured Fibrobacter sp.]
MCRKIFYLVILAVTFSFAGNYDFFFKLQKSNYFCISTAPYQIAKFNADGKLCPAETMLHDVRIRFRNPIVEQSAVFGMALQRPFFILDGIYLSTDGVRTLSDFEDEANRLGIMDVLEELGYTPILVQFTETVRTSLDDNARYFAELLKFFNENKLIGFPDKMESGMVVMGISQGGILGRYGAYLYDIQRNKSKDAPIRLYASLDSPHQGAILPLSLYYTINFWAILGGSAEAEAFSDLIEGPGASGLLLYERQKPTSIFETINPEYEVSMSSSRFLFGEYRKAAEYQGFPSVLVAQGQLKGMSPKHPEKYFTLNRRAKKAGILMGRAESEMASYNKGEKRIAKNRVYQKFSSEQSVSITKDAEFDFIQGSTYPFAETMYNSLHAGFEDAMPSDMSVNILGVSASLSTAWDEDTLLQKNSTFIPTASAMDMKCSGNLAMRGECAFKQSSSDFPFTKPGTRSTADAAYAVDPTHPRYNEPISGRHIELPEQLSGNEESAVVKGFQVDMWRILCELANYDYDSRAKAFRNEKLEWYFLPNGNCMDQTKIPQLIRESGFVQAKKFGYARYDYKSKATENTESVRFDLPAGWHKVALFDNGRILEAGTAFEVDVTVNQTKGNWMKGEIMLSKTKNGVTQIQLHEISIPVDGKKFVAHWQLPSGEESISAYRWIRLILNSDGGNVTLSNPRIVKSLVSEEVPKVKVAKNLYPNADYSFVAWQDSTLISKYSDALGSGIRLNFDQPGYGAHLDFGGMKDLSGFSTLEIAFWPGSCQQTVVYLYSSRRPINALRNATASGAFMKASIPLDQIVDTRLTPNGMLAASRLSIQGTAVNETCLIKSVNLK